MPADRPDAPTDASATPAGFHLPALGVLWLALAVAYLAASASGHPALALSVVGLMAGALLAAASGSHVAGLAAGIVLAAACWYWSASMAFAAYAPPLAAFAFMAYFFHRTLRSGSEPLITRVARTEHPGMPPDIAHYTRALTRLWSLCFAFLFGAALLSAPFLALDDWSRRIHALGYLLPAALFLGEYAYRHHRFRQHRHVSLPVLIGRILVVIRDAAVEPR